MLVIPQFKATSIPIPIPIMKLTPRSILLSCLLFFATAAALCAAESSPSSGSGATGFLQSPWAKLWIPVVVPLLVAGLRIAYPLIPPAALPILCPPLGIALSFVGQAIGQDIDPGIAAALGLAGVGLREIKDQLGKRNIVGLSRQLAMAALVAISFLPGSLSAAPAGVGGAGAGPAPEPPDAWSRLTVSPFASYRVNDTARFNGKFGGGLAAGFALNPHITLELETVAERFDDSHWADSFTEAGANFKLYPFAGGVVRPYGLLGYTRNLDFDENRMNAGAGRWTHNFDHVGQALFRGGVNIRLGR